MDETTFPEHEKLKAHQDEARTVGDFIDWLNCEGILLCARDDYDELYPIRKRIEDIIGDFLEIDPKKLEQEKRRMLDEIRVANARAANK